MACDRRDADAALRHIECIHAANAPLQIGRKGVSFFDSAVSRLKRIALNYASHRSASDTDSQAKSNFAGLLAEARRQQQEQQKTNGE
jgi:hypothetical protein